MTEQAQFAGFAKSRVETFSDGVFVVIVTLLVFDLKLPPIGSATNDAVWQGIVGVAPKLFGWANSFLIVCVIWMNHHRLIDQFRSIDTGLFWLNNVLLMCCSLIPFPTAVLGDYPGTPVAVSFYGVCLALPALCFTALRLYAFRHPALLVSGLSLSAFRKTIGLSFVYGPVLYWFGAALSWVRLELALLVYFFIPVYFIFPVRQRL